MSIRARSKDSQATRLTASAPLSTTTTRWPAHSSMPLATIWLMALSSTSRMLRLRSVAGSPCPVGPDRLAGSADNARAGPVMACSAARGKSSTKRNSLPRPGWLVSASCPPINRTSWFEMLRPSPVPPNWRVIDPSACVKASKTLACCSIGMPTPVSWTANPIPCGCTDTVKVTRPAGVNLMALPSRLVSTCRKRTSSPCTSAGVLASQHKSRARFFSSQRLRSSSMSSSTSVRRLKSTGCKSSRPASIFEKSRMSFRITSKASPER